MTTAAKTPSSHDVLARSLVQIKQLRAELDQVRAAQHEPIAIVGIGCRLPGGIEDPEQLRTALRSGFDAVREIPDDRWDLAELFDADADAKGKMYTRHGAFLDRVDDCDAPLFGISPREAASMDPQQRMFLEVAHEALERAGLDIDALEGSDTGVFTGVSTYDYGARQLQHRPLDALDPYFMSGNLASFISGRVAYTFGLHGPCLSVDTACSSSLVAVHLGVAALRRGETSMAIAGGVNVILSPEWNVVLSRAKMMAPDGRCKTFDASADGYVRGEGCGVVVLKRLSDAERDGDAIVAVIRGTAINQDGPASGITVPNGIAQQGVIQAALADARLQPTDVGYVEAHGTGTSLGDPIEVRSLAAVYGQGRDAGEPLQLGSIKTNLGHLESAAGIVGLIKAALSVSHGELFAHLHLQSVNPEIDLQAIPAEIPTSHRAWERHDGQLRRAGISSFGASGTNAHVILEEPPPVRPLSAVADPPESEHLLVISARTREALDALAARYHDHLEDFADGDWAELCASTQHGRATLAHRLGLVAKSPAHARAALAGHASGEPPRALSVGHARGAVPKVAMLFAGQGSQVLGMGRQLHRRYPEFREAFDRCAEILRPVMARSLEDVIDGASDPASIDQTAFTQPAIFAVEYALSELWRAWGVRPAAVLGHSVGEYVAATVAGVFDLETGLRLIATRGKMMQELAGDGGMVSLLADEARVAALAEPFAAEISLAAINGPTSVVVSGLRPALDEFTAAAKAEGIKVKSLTVSHGFHSPQMEPMIEAFRSEVARCELSAPRIPLASNLQGALADDEIRSPEYWCRHVRAPVRFADGLASLVALGMRTFVEVGGHPTLTTMAQPLLPEDAQVVPSLRRGKPEGGQMLESLGRLFTRGIKPRWDAVQARPERRIPLPAYPYQRRRYWAPELEGVVPSSPAVAANHAAPGASVRHPLVDRRVPTPLAAGQFEVFLSHSRQPYLRDFIIEDVNVVNIGIYVEMIRAVVDEVQPEPGPLALEDLSMQRACVLGEHGVSLHVVLAEAGSDAYDVSLHGSVQGGEWAEHCTARVSPTKVSPGAFEAPAGPFALDLDGDGMYDTMTARGITLGPAGRWIERVRVIDDDALVDFREPIPSDGATGYVMHPGVIDAMFQAAYAVLPADVPPDSVYMLVGAAHVRLYPGGRPARAHVQRRLWDSKARALTIDVRMVDEHDVVIAEVGDAVLKYASREILLAQLESPGAVRAVAAGDAVPSTVLALRNAEPAEREQVLSSKLQHQLADILGAAPAEIELQVSLLELGLDSLMAVELKRSIEQSCAVLVPLVDLLGGPTLAELAAKLLPTLALEPEGSVDANVQLPGPSVSTIVPDPDGRGEPFSLTDLQQAYLIGRGSDFSLGNVSTYFFLEVEIEALDLERFEQAWNQIVERHDMLRAVFTEDGQQRVLPTVPRYQIAVGDLRELSSSQREQALTETAEQVRSRVFDTARWPMFDIRASQVDARTTRLHLGFDALVVDAWSTSLVFGEWAALYAGRSLPKLSLRFRDYMNAVDEIRRSEAYARDLAYWEARVEQLPPAPELPLCAPPDALARPEFTHRTGRMPADAWARFQQRARQAKVTPSVALSCAYSEIVATWSRNRHFTLNLLFFNRLPLHDEVKDVAANFSSTTLLEIDMRGAEDFTTRVQKIQRQLADDLDHGLVTGVEVLRRINRQRGGTRSATMPVVFASTLNLRAQDKAESSFALTGNLLQMGEGGRELGSSIRTPQVWLDHQVIEENGCLVFNWDVVEDLFPAGMVDTMFARYTDLLNRLADDPQAWTEVLRRIPLPAAELHERQAKNATALEIAARPLHEAFLLQAQHDPSAAALVTSSRSLDYGELDRRSEVLAHALLERGLRSAELVAVVMHKGWEQVVAVLAIHKAGGAYLPIDPALPQERVHHLIDHAGARQVVTQPALDAELTWPASVPRLTVGADDPAPPIGAGARLQGQTDPHALAYVIYTSGSTGLPKGVAVTHAAAWNTIADINARFEVGRNDRTFGVSSLSFDLSVYDVFGPLSVGGALVIPEGSQSRDPAAWAELVRTQGVTVWNSVPALMQMLSEQVAAAGDGLRPLRLAMLSGDWIPVGLPDAIAAIDAGVRVVSLGGATEAAIWSIHYPIAHVPESWTSIPYGRPLANQRFHVLDDDLEPRPTWVAGELYIGGDGLALGYWNDPQRSAASFFEHPRTGERLYRTGDMGRYLGDGDIEFLGREDTQVKVQGYRIELGEIEAALERIDGLKAGVVTVLGERAGSKTLVGYLVPTDGEVVDVDRVRQRLGELIPPYMVPTTFVVLDALPLTSNGKVDRKALPSAQQRTTTRERVDPRNDTERALVELWSELLDVSPVGINEDFFELGGQSFLAMRMMARIHERFGVRFALSALLENRTIESLAAKIARPGDTEPWSAVVEVQPGTGAPLVLVHPVGGNVLCYTALSRALGSRRVVGLQARGLEQGQAPLGSIEDMAREYLSALRERGISGPLMLGGWSLGGVVAYEMARQLEADGHAPTGVVMIDSRLETIDDDSDTRSLLADFMLDLARVGGRTFALRPGHWRADDAGQPDLAAVLRDAHAEQVAPEDLDLPAFERLWQVYRAGIEALAAYGPGAIDAPVHELIAQQEAAAPVRGRWEDLVRGPHRAQTLAGDHYSLLMPPHRDALVQALVAILDK